jgi:hypothetical protein
MRRPWPIGGAVVPEGEREIQMEFVYLIFIYQINYIVM